MMLVIYLIIHIIPNKIKKYIWINYILKNEADLITPENKLNFTVKKDTYKKILL